MAHPRDETHPVLFWRKERRAQATTLPLVPPNFTATHPTGPPGATLHTTCLCLGSTAAVTNYHQPSGLKQH